MKFAIQISFCVSLMGVLTALGHADGPVYQVVQRIPIPGDGGWDYLTVDPEMRRLFISHSTHVDVLDVDRTELVSNIPDTPGVHGITLSPDRGFISNGREGSVTIFDRQTLAVIGKTKVGDNPDAILYDSASRRVFTFNGRSEDATAIDAASGRVVGQIALGGRPEFAVADGSGTVFDNLEDRSELVALDAKQLKVKNRWPLAPCVEPSSLAMDLTHRRLFVGCGNRQMAVIDAETGRVITTLPIGEHVDATVFDPATGEIFNANGDGTLTIIHEDSADAYHVETTLVTQKGARTIALDPQTHRLFLATAQFGAAPAAAPGSPHPRPAIVPGSFIILVVASK